MKIEDLITKKQLIAKYPFLKESSLEFWNRSSVRTKNGLTLFDCVVTTAHLCYYHEERFMKWYEHYNMKVKYKRNKK